ncbi:MAG TPA: glycoside hydrolase [Candidatus Omnitrophica bacterium]|nr:glycoside hydrolase [Candidatus Omnitrophota bacterium]
MQNRVKKITKGITSKTSTIELFKTVKKSLFKKKIYFELAAPAAKKVALTGNFKAWDVNGIPMKKDKDGLWRVGVELAPGRYEYKFIVDQQWWTDPANKQTVMSPSGTVNSLKEISI